MHITPCEQAWEPREVAVHLADAPGLAWLDGGLSHGREGRWSFVAAHPCEIHTRGFGVDSALSLLADLPVPGAGTPAPAGLLDPADVPCWIGHVAYDAFWSGRRSARHARTHVPVVRFARYDALYAFDHESSRAFLVGDDAHACERLRLRLTTARSCPSELAFAAELRDVTSRATHHAAIERALEHIRAGDVYVINLARRYRAAFSGSRLGLFLRMRELSPVPLGYFVDGGDHALLGRSMERFLRFEADGRRVYTSPIKGTIAHAGDERSEHRSLLEDPKEQAEHAMVVDLMRNDLSWVCEVGSVQVTDLMRVETFRGLSHLVSTVEGKLRRGVLMDELLRQTFPPGSVTGTPKRRAIELIEELEDAPRGVYTGALGMLDRAGGCSFAVAIRGAVVEDAGAEYWAGGGIVAASDPTRELDETELKAQVFLRALGSAGGER